MATENVPVFNQYVGNGEATRFSIGFPYLDKKYVKVYIKRLDGVQEELTENRYSFENDTTILFPVKEGDEVLQDGDVLAIQRETDLGSEYEFNNQRRLFPEEVMNADDLSFQQIQEMARDLARCWHSLPTDLTSGPELFEQYLEALNRVNEMIDMVIQIENNLSQIVEELGSLADEINGEII